MVESMCNGEFIDKTVDDAWSFLAELAEQTHQWEPIRETMILSHDMGNSHELESDFDSNTNMNCMTRRVEALEKCRNANVIVPRSCTQTELHVCMSCDSSDHLIENCPELHGLRQSRTHHVDALYDTQDTHSQTCTPEWKNPCYNDDDELNFENSVSSPTRATENEYEPHVEKNEWTKDIKAVNREEYVDYSDYDMRLEDLVLHEDSILESCDSKLLDHSVETSIDNVSSNVDIHRNQYPDDFGTDLGLVQLFCESEHVTQLVCHLGNAEFFVDTNDNMHENNFDVSDSLPRLQHDVSSGFLMHETEIFDDDDSELGFVGLFNEYEHDIALVSDLGSVESCNDTDENNLDRFDSLLKSQHDCLNVGREHIKPTLWTVPSLGLDLCASQVLLDYFSAKYDTFEEPRLECVSLPVPYNVHYELDLVHNAPLKLVDFVSKSISVEKSRFRGGTFGFAVLLALSCYICVRLLMFIHVIVWVDPQLFRLYIYGEFSLYIIQ
ncbi:uncharacterized protein LOC113356657 [Papaver somniferum]|uniref:uncharacterized protein LOC113356657 n=1 Tax=Papaver somniferum TaxID=3469 RepID=UPI000E6FF843|nr:uncharacterized protein LOC113356657 [Papaver somniferum]XP_026455642.1 uncharacterized protein LOC113356657 [Papaver somniferum]XP_026455643.1 uncharacterized protein LOC113356657 [Papaver somniferum]XP_026455645.1 uncharacterized protein LOC113356657 [Papaver somniferum]